MELAVQGSWAEPVVDVAMKPALVILETKAQEVLLARVVTQVSWENLDKNAFTSDRRM